MAFTSRTSATSRQLWRRTSEKRLRCAWTHATWPKSVSSTRAGSCVRRSALSWPELRFLFERFFAPEISVGESCAVFYGTGRAPSIRSSK